MAFCSQCGFKNEVDSNFCQSCGAPIKIASVSNTLLHGEQIENESNNYSKNDSDLNGNNTASAPDDSSNPSIIEAFGKSLINPVTFVVVYILFMMPTYFLPYLGSNSTVINGLGAATGVGLNPALWFHVGSLSILVFTTWMRSKITGKGWLVSMPIAASMFDLMPGLSLIPMIPTMLHMITIILGAKEETRNH